VVGHQVDEDLRPDRDRVVPPVLVVRETRQPVEPRGAVDGEPGHPVGERRPVPDVVLGGVAACELGQDADELRMDGSAVVALHEVLDDELPVGGHVVDDAPPHGQRLEPVRVDRLERAQPAGDRAHHPLLERRRVLGQADPDVTQPLARGDGHKPALGTVDVRHPGQVGRRRQLPVQLVRPRVIGAPKIPADLPGLLGADARAAMSADVEQRPQPAVALPHHEHALAARLDGLELPGPADVAGPRDAEPVALEDRQLLALEHVGVGVIGPGQRRDQRRIVGHKRNIHE
jgi:hypothetical protein